MLAQTAYFFWELPESKDRFLFGLKHGLSEDADLLDSTAPYCYDYFELEDTTGKGSNVEDSNGNAIDVYKELDATDSEDSEIVELASRETHFDNVIIEFTNKETI